jgi:hypothetical protein
MSTPTSNTSATSSLSIGLIVGGIVLATIIIAVVVYVIKSRRNGGNLGAAPSMPSVAGPNAGMPSPINTNVNSTRLSNGNGRPQ